MLWPVALLRQLGREYTVRTTLSSDDDARDNHTTTITTGMPVLDVHC